MPDLTPLEAAETLELHAPFVGGTYRDAMLKAAADERKIASGEYAPVVHAHITGRGYDLHCSNCGVSTDIGKNYCHFCGAVFDGKDDSHA